jgi:MFS family permease
VEHLNATGIHLASDVGLVAGTAALVGALVSPLGGAIGDRIGFRTVLVGALLGGGVVIAIAPFAPTVLTLALVALVFATATAIVSAMVFGLLATEVPPERRSATLNLVYLPLYAAGLVGPLAGSVVVGAGLPAPFLVAGAVLGLTGTAIFLRLRRDRGAPDAPEVIPPADRGAPPLQ